jgi:hypothetical protein
MDHLPMLLPGDVTSTEQQPLAPGCEEEEGAVAFLSLSGTTSNAAKVVTNHFLPEHHEYQQGQQQAGLLDFPAGPSVGYSDEVPLPASTAAEQQASSRSQSSTPTGWRNRMFTTARQQQQQQQQQAPSLPPGCLVLDGKALVWHDYEEADEQQAHQRQQKQRQKMGYKSDSGSSSPREQGRQSPRMRASCSSPNLVLLADGSHTRGLQQPQQQQQQYQQGTELQPMHSSQSCDSLLALCKQAHSCSSSLYMPTQPPPAGAMATAVAAAAAVQVNTSAAAGAAVPKSRLGRPTGGDTPRGQAQQSLLSEQPAEQQQQQQRVLLQEVQQVDLLQQWNLIQQQAQQQEQQQLFGYRLTGSSAGAANGNWQQRQQQQQQQHGFSPQPRVPQDEFAVGGSSSSARVTSWTFSRCNSGLSEALGRKLRVHCVSFNMNGKLPASVPPDMLGECGALEGLEAAGSLDLLVFATQVGQCRQ